MNEEFKPAESQLGTSSSVRRTILPPEPVGYWISHDNYVHFEVYKKPKWLWRKMTKILLGWGYKDNNKSNINNKTE